MPDLPRWLSEVERELRGLATTDRLPHAILLDAPWGWGIDVLARSLVKSLLRIDGEPAEVADPNLLWIEAETSQIKIDEIRNLIEFLTRTHRSDSIKLAVVNDSERMNQYAANALLKILEEPPGGKHVVLITTEPASLLPTIRSRTQRFSVKRESSAEVLNWLRKNGCDVKNTANLMTEFGEAPYAILAASQERRIPIREQLVRVWRNPNDLSDVASEFSKSDFVDLVSRWQRIVARYFLQRSRDTEIFEFYHALCDLKRMHHETPALDARLHFERMLCVWLELRSK